MNNVWFAYAAAWIATALAVCVCIYFTHRIAPMWFLILPALQNVRSRPDEKAGESNG